MCWLGESRYGEGHFVNEMTSRQPCMKQQEFVQWGSERYEAEVIDRRRLGDSEKFGDRYTT
jgi:hypothetical protein